MYTSFHFERLSEKRPVLPKKSGVPGLICIKSGQEFIGTKVGNDDRSTVLSILPPPRCPGRRFPVLRTEFQTLILRPLRITSLQNKKRLFEKRIRAKSKVDKYSQCILQHSGCVRTASQEAGDDSSCRSALFRDRHPRPSAAHESRAFCE